MPKSLSRSVDTTPGAAKKNGSLLLTRFCERLNLALNELMKERHLKKSFVMKSFTLFFFSCMLLTLLSATTGFTQDITLTSTPVGASNIIRGTTDNVVYIVKMDVSVLPVTINTIQFTLTGTHDNDDLSYASVYFNAATPTVSGSTQLVVTSGSWAAPHTYFLPANRTIAAGAFGYFIITVETNPNTATNGNTVKLNGSVNPVAFGYTTAPSITNNQTDAAGTQTIQAPAITLNSSLVAAAVIINGTNNNPVYIVNTNAPGLSVTINSIQFTLTGTHDNNDITIIKIFFNATAPTVAGATFLNSTSGLFAAPHTYTFPVSRTIAAGTSGYFIITVDLDAVASIGNTIKLNGAVNPVVFGYTIPQPDLTNNQSDAAGTQTISTALPLTLVSFAGNIINTQEVQLQWKTAGESNTKDFEVEWSNDGLLFNKAAILPAAGNSTQDLYYSYLHKLPVDGDNYYRLKMTDKDARFTYSPVLKINMAITKIKIDVFPNPVIDLLQLYVQAIKNETIIFHLYNADGKTIASKPFTLYKGSNKLSWDLQQLPSGNYFISSGSSNPVVRITSLTAR
jgi:Secretion system C-terminal sorting domain